MDAVHSGCSGIVVAVYSGCSGIVVYGGGDIVFWCKKVKTSGCSGCSTQ